MATKKKATKKTDGADGVRVRTEVRLGPDLHALMDDISDTMGLSMNGFLTASTAIGVAFFAPIVTKTRRKLEIVKIARENFERLMKDIEEAATRDSQKAERKGA